MAGEDGWRRTSPGIGEEQYSPEKNLPVDKATIANTVLGSPPRSGRPGPLEGGERADRPVLDLWEQD